MSINDIENTILRRAVLIVATPIVVPLGLLYLACVHMVEVCGSLAGEIREVWRAR